MKSVAKRKTKSSHGLEKGDIVKPTAAGLRVFNVTLTRRTRAVVMARRPGLYHELVRIKLDPATMNKRALDNYARFDEKAGKPEIWNGDYWTKV